MYDISDVINAVWEHNWQIQKAKEDELKAKLDAGEIDQETYDNEIHALSFMEYEDNCDEESPFYSKLWDLIDRFDDDFNDFCELDGTLEPYIKALDELKEEMKNL